MGYKEDLEQSKKWMVEDALKTLVKAKEIEADEELMAEVTKLAKAQSGAIKSIADLKAKADELEKEELESEEEDDEEGDMEAAKEGKLPKGLEENSYINRVKAVEKEAQKVDAEVVTLQKDDEDEEDGDE